MGRKAGLWCALMGGVWMASGAPALAADTAAVIETYADVAHAKYEDALKTAEALEKAIDALIAKPTEDNLKAARAAWLAARDPYQQTEGYRFGNPIVDDWEGKVNAWPLDEGLIDYVAEAYGTESDDNPLYTANVIANTSITFGGETIDTSKITKELLADKLHESADSEANVATGYHAIEFLLWGQDLNGTGPGAGNRPATDYDTANCTHGNCDRRAAVSEDRGLAAGRRSQGDGRQLDRGRRGPQGAARCRRQRRADHDADRPRQPQLRRAGGRAHEARPHPARPGGGA